MNRRKFFSNLVASVGTLVAVYATPISRVRLPVKLEWTHIIRRGAFPSNIGVVFRAL